MGFRLAMFRVLNMIIGVLAFPIIAAGIWVLVKDNTNCVTIHEWAVIVVIGVFILVLSPIGVFGSTVGRPPLIWIYLALTFILILLLSSFTIVSFLATNRGAGVGVPGKSFKEYHLAEYSDKLQSHFALDGTWGKTKSCLLNNNVCTNLDRRYPTLEDFDNAKLSPVESGCCKPPAACGFTFVNATYWTSPQNVDARPDCATWSNDKDELCFNCMSCRAGVLQNVKHDWRTVTIANTIMLLFLIVVYVIGCCAFFSAKKEYDENSKFNFS